MEVENYICIPTIDGLAALVGLNIKVNHVLPNNPRTSVKLQYQYAAASASSSNAWSLIVSKPCQRQ